MTGLPKHLRLKAAAPVFQGAGLRDWQLTVLLRSPSRGDREILRRAFQNGAASGQEAEGAVLLTFLLGQMKSFLAGQVADFRQAPATAELHGFLADFPPVRQWIWEVKGRRISLRERTLIMGVINVTPDSFSDGGRYISAGRAVEHGLSLAEAGADILDVGGESTRPGAEPVPEAEERRRVLPVIEKLKAQTDLLISVDTYKASVARAAVKAGADIVNDISGFHFDPEMAGVVAESGAGAVLMHIRGTPRNMQQNPQYSDVIEEILVYL
ncbi:MAG TPA: dihydropteroate synthase, partial [Bacteroidetes bacterium]|nr:dihydropteroate synthase [Bacteroidota bacterium]